MEWYQEIIKKKLKSHCSRFQPESSLVYIIFSLYLLLIGENVDIQKSRYSSRFASTRLTISLQV